MKISIENGIAISHHENLIIVNENNEYSIDNDNDYYTYFNGYIRSALSIPGPYDNEAAKHVSNMRPKFNAWLLINWMKIN